MAIAGIDHYTILTEDLAATRRFYCDFLGLRDGPRPPFDFPGAWLYAGDHPIVHVIAGRAIPPGGTGAVDHVAFRGQGDPDQLKRKLEEKGFQVASRVVPASRIRQLFLDDPSGVKVELNFQMG
jgi:catechol 2,3-dioxygenase-like lactoylglutathione lyase family enzyme